MTANGNYLDEECKTTDFELEKLKAAEVLSDIWSRTVIDGHPVDSQALPQDQEFVPPTEKVREALELLRLVLTFREICTAKLMHTKLIIKSLKSLSTFPSTPIYIIDIHVAKYHDNYGEILIVNTEIKLARLY